MTAEENVGGSCLGNPQRSEFGGLLRKNAGLFVYGLSGNIANAFDILLAELHAIFQGLRMVSDMGISDFVCYSDSLHYVSLINDPSMRFHVYVTLIQNIKDLIITSKASVFHTLREGNYCANFLAKLGAASDSVLTIHASPPDGMIQLIKDDTLETLFPRAIRDIETPQDEKDGRSTH
ncbi:uncharacterized protein [Medicago truncatula]|uniref:uncharacterized protein n=1 Tax=Medicago truncatula TaxID=3880 RepID=UPI000D2F287F|nr:uncharacterized protein LOC112422036 [Medicago truncatula]